MSFNLNTLSKDDLVSLNEAIERTAPRVRFWYSLPSANFF